MIGVSKLAKSFGARTLFEGATFQLNAGSRYGLVGANGSGKSTFMKVLAGDEPATDGLVTFPPNARVGVLRQDHFLSDAEQILALAMRGDARTYALLEERSAIVDRGEGDPHRLADIEHELSTLGGTTLEARATAVLVGLGIPAAQHRQPLSTLSGGFKLRVLLGAGARVGARRALARRADEPPRHPLDPLARGVPRRAIAAWRSSSPTTCASSTPWRRTIVDVDYGAIKAYPGNYAHFVQAKQEERERKESQIEKQEAVIAEHKAFVERFRSKATKARVRPRASSR
jgi:ATPase subunit of ABC transporter with duplicated ATPase domains